MTDFLDDIQEESYSDALTSGNLKPKPREELERFTSTGYTAAIHVCLCTGCGVITRTLGSIMHREVGSKGSIRAQGLHLGHIPQITGSHPTTYLGSKTKVCASCVGNYGFIPDPEAEQRVIS